MNVFIKPLTIPGLKKFSGLVHGSSPRHYYSAEGGRNPLFPSGIPGPVSSREEKGWFLHSLGIDSREVFLVKQIHGGKILLLDDSPVSVEDAARVQADAIVTAKTQVPIGVLTADCIPIILYDPLLRVVGVIHAGRKGTGNNILSKTICFLQNHFGSRTENLVVGMGPGIGGCCYEVKEACLVPFRENYPDDRDLFHPAGGGKYYLDLFRANEEDGLRAGIRAGKIFRSEHCTACRRDLLYSFRREGTAGRILTVALLR